MPTPISQVPTPICLSPPRQIAIHTAIPIFRTLANLAASSGFKFSIIVSCASVPGSAVACSSLSSNQHIIPLHIQSPKTTHTAAAAPDCHRLARTQFASRLQSGCSAAVDAQRREAETGLLHPSRAQLRSELRAADGALTTPLTLILNNKTRTKKKKGRGGGRNNRGCSRSGPAKKSRDRGSGAFGADLARIPPSRACTPFDIAPGYMDCIDYALRATCDFS